jgi:galactose mutarotase-like enzyme
LYFSVGGHPAFAVPLTKDTNYEDYYLVFDKQENTPRWPISNDGLIENTPDPLLQHSDRLPLTKELFSKDALVLKSLKSSLISVRSDKTEHGLRFDFPGFPFLGLWAAKGADFLCIEPWCGIADSVNTSQQLEEKEGINALEPGGEFSRTWIVKVF